MTIDEQKLIADCKQGKPRAQKVLYNKYAPVMMGVCIRYVNNKETARDVLQEGFIKVFTKMDTYSGGSFPAWVRRIFVTTALESLRQHNVLRFAEEITDYREDVDDSVMDKISADELMACITKLPDGYKTVFNLYAIEGYSHAEIGEILQISEGTSRSQYSRARKLLQETIQSIL